MKSLPTRRYKKLYERILLAPAFSLIVGWMVCIALPAILYWGATVFQRPNTGQKTAIVATTLAYLVMYLAARLQLTRFPGGRSSNLIISQVFSIYTFVFLVTLLTHIGTSRMLLLASGGIALMWFLFEYLIAKKYLRLKLAIVPGGLTKELLKLNVADIRPLDLQNLTLGDTRYDGVVADFYKTTPEIERFLTACALEGVPVYNANTVFESLTGRVKIHHMHENIIGSLLPSPTYNVFKLILEWAIVLITLPLTVPICLVTALIIKIESPGPVLFTQQRIGKGGQPFVIYKFRSMRHDKKNTTERFAEENDPRITRVGAIIRKLRIDELPQILNVLSGDMSLIGPRPEQEQFVKSFAKNIPFYSYRHVVKPGITGWAQVCLGYTDDESTTREKIEHDFYYIKRCSISLDLFIMVLTLKTIITGFGSR